ncbi:MAG: hypothetical protein VX966_04595 [Chloroflexota bacterium]|nr:hypothetical protein [Chloroflexota bacterium]
MDCESRDGFVEIQGKDVGQLPFDAGNVTPFEFYLQITILILFNSNTEHPNNLLMIY